MSIQLALDQFAFRQFDDPEYVGTRVTGTSKEEFERHVNQYYHSTGGEANLVEGYAPFCKHLFMPNFTDATVNAIKVTNENEHLLRTSYDARTEKELPVLTRWFPKEVVVPHKAKYLDIILYSREQIRLENESMGLPTPDTDAPWGIISIKAQDVDSELPMNPITVMRNGLGKDQGGSGVPITREEYMKSVDYWSKYAVFR